MPLKIVTDFDREDGRSRFVEYQPPRDRAASRPDPVRPPGRPLRGGLQPVATSVRDFVLGLDLGQAADFTALAVVERMPTGYSVPFLARTRGKPYPEIVAKVADLVRRPPLASASRLVVDATGVGRPVLDMIRAAGLDPLAVTITAGAKVSGGRRAARVPKRDLVTALLVAFQAGTLKIAASLPHASTLAAELSAMRVRITAAGTDQYGPWREGEHDDLVLALALAVWTAERTPRLVAHSPAAPRPAPAPRPALRPFPTVDELADRLDALNARMWG